MKRIVIPIDFSDVTDRVIEFVVPLANAFEAKLWLVHVAQPHPDFNGLSLAQAEDWRDISVLPVHQPLITLAEKLNAKGLITTPVLLQGPPVECIHETAKAVDADMIVLGSHGHGALYDLLVGSVSEGVMRYSTVPVCIVPSPQEA